MSKGEALACAKRCALCQWWFVGDGQLAQLVCKAVPVRVTAGRHQHDPTCRTGSNAAGAKVVVKVRKRHIQLE